MEPMRRIQYGCALLFPCRPERIACNCRRNRCMTMNKLILVFFYQLAQFLIRAIVLRRKRRTIKRHYVVFITIRNIFRFIRFKVISGTDMDFISVIFKPFHIRQMELKNMLFSHRCNKQHGFTHIHSPLLQIVYFNQLYILF